MIVTDVAGTNTIKNLLHEHICLLPSHITILHLLIVRLNITLVLVNADPAITTPLSNDINPYIVLLLNHVLIAIEIDHTAILKTTQSIIINLLLTSLRNQLHLITLLL